jgi:Rrf2 family protein
VRLNQGVEWALHTCLNLGWAEVDGAAPAARLAAFYDLPPAYLNKQLQALVKAGILTSTPGPRGGFRLARRLEAISVLDVVVAIEGRVEFFGCAQILRAGPDGDPAEDYRRSCEIAGVMQRADLAWRRELADESLADIRDRVEAAHPEAPRRTRAWLTNVSRG